MKIDFLTINNLRLRYAFLNNHTDSNLLILPGWGGTLEAWQNFLNGFDCADFNVYFLELPGFGKSDPPLEAWQLADYASCIKAAIIKFDLKNLSLFGHSFGGQIAACLAANEPQLLRKLFLSGPAIIREPKKSFKLPRFVKVLVNLPFLKPLKKIFYYFFASRDYAAIKNPIMKETFQNIITTDGRVSFKNIAIPVIMFWGTNDTYTPLKQGLLLKELLPSAELKIFEESGHGLHLQQPQELQNLIKEKI